MPLLYEGDAILLALPRGLGSYYMYKYCCKSLNCPQITKFFLLSQRKDKKRQQQQPVTQLLEDQALNAELDAANTGGMVETERDRLIRIVSAQNSVYYPVANEPGIFCHKQLSLGATDLHHASHPCNQNWHTVD